MVVSATGTLYASTLKGLLALDALGATLPPITSGRYALTAPALDAAGNLYFADGLGNFAAYAPTGAPLWNRPVGREADPQSPVITPDRTIVLSSSTSTTNYDLIALCEDGTERWRLTLPARPTCDVAVGPNGVLFFGTLDGRFRAVGPEGTPLWDFPTTERWATTPAVSPAGVVYAVLAETNAPGTLPEGRIRRSLCALRPDGSVLWSASLDCGTRPPAVALAANETVLVHSGTNLAAFGPEGRLLWMCEGGPGTISPPVLGLDGRLYWTADKVLIALQTATGPPANAWAMWRAHPRATASCNRPAPPRLLATREADSIRLQLTEPPATAIQLLQGGTPWEWSIITNYAVGSNPSLLLPVGPGALQFYRVAIP